MVEEGRTWGIGKWRCFFVLASCYSACSSGLVANKWLSASLMSMTPFHLLVAIRFYCWRQEAETDRYLEYLVVE